MERLLGYRFRRTTIVGLLCVSVLCGIGLARIMHFEGIWIIAAGFSTAICVKKRNFVTLLAIIVLGLSIGGWRGSIQAHKLSAYNGVYDHKVSIVAQASGDGVYGKNSQLSFDVSNARVVSEGGRKLIGKIGVSGFGENAVFRGDTIMVEGKIRPGKGSYQGWMSYAQLHVTEHHSSFIDTLRRKFAAGMQSALPEPAASFGMGLLIGQRSTLPKEVSQDLLMVGLVHIIAVSGYNLTILLRASWRLFGNRSKYQTMVLSVALIGLFLLLTGSSASIVRAAIVSLLSIAAWYYGRNFKPVVLLLMAAAATSLANPLYEWSDIGWYLSFLAFYGVLVLAPQLRRNILRRWQNSTIANIALESLCAEIMTLPLVLYIFGQLSLISLVANVLVAALVPLAMLLTLIAGLAGMLITPIAGWFAWPASLLLTYMLDVSHLLASIPHIFIQHQSLSLLGMLSMYIVVAFVSLVVQSRSRRKGAMIQGLTEEHVLLRPSYLYAAPAPRE